MLAAILSNHPEIACGPETHLYSKITQETYQRIIADPEWPKLAIEETAKLTLADQQLFELYKIPPKVFENELSKVTPSIRNVVSTFLNLYASSQGKRRWLEKTPNHMRYLEAILETFPTARIIFSVRDPRDSAISMSKLHHWRKFSTIQNAYTIRSWHMEFERQRFDRSKICFVKYEDLVANPREALQPACEHIGIPYSDDLLDTRESGKKVSSANEPWKNAVSDRLDASRVFAWERKADPGLAAALSYLLEDYIAQHGYRNPNPNSAKEVPCVGLTERNLDRYSSGLERLAQTGVLLRPARLKEVLLKRHWFLAEGRGSKTASKIHKIQTFSPIHKPKWLEANTSPETISRLRENRI